jgi:hypothetical protein
MCKVLNKHTNSNTAGANSPTTPCVATGHGNFPAYCLVDSRAISEHCKSK